jgi:hypothetical protein
LFHYEQADYIRSHTITLDYYQVFLILLIKDTTVELTVHLTFQRTEFDVGAVEDYAKGVRHSPTYKLYYHVDVSTH